MLCENRTVQIATIPFRGHDGLLWNQLHEEREEICEALLRISSLAYETERELLQTQLKSVDDVLDELMSGKL
jgi:hypothetical protein